MEAVRITGVSQNTITKSCASSDPDKDGYVWQTVRDDFEVTDFDISDVYPDTAASPCYGLSDKDFDAILS